MRYFTTLCFAIVYGGFLIATGASPAVAQPLTSPRKFGVPTLPTRDPTSLPQLAPRRVEESSNSQLRRYRLGPGDTIAVSVQNYPEFNFQTVINPEGKVVAPILGTVLLEGLTLEEAQATIRLSLDEFVIDPIMSVSIVQQRPVQVTITGEVNRPGIHPINSATPRISEALLAAGGTTAIADLRTIKVRRTLTNGLVVEQSVDMLTPLQNGIAMSKLRLQDGDTVIVPKREVGTDKGYDRALVARSTMAQQQIKIRVLNYPKGEVKNVQLPNGSTFVDALAEISPNPDKTKLRKITLIRLDPERGKATTWKLDGKDALRGDASQDIQLQDKDVIVFGRNFVGGIGNVLDTITQPFRNILGLPLLFGD